MTTPAKSGPPNDPPKPGPPKPTPRRLHLLWIIGLGLTALLLFVPSSSGSSKSLSFTDWKTQVGNGQVKSATIDPSGKVTGQLNDKNHTSYQSRVPAALNDNTLAGFLDQHKVQVKGTGASTSFWTVVLGFLPLLILVGLFFWISRRASRSLAGGGFMGIGASKAKVYDEERPTTRFTDVAGYEGAKREISEVVDFLKFPGRYAAAGAIGPRGVLMVGPPGTGKTLIARAVAGEADVPFFAITGSSFVELFVGVGAARMRDLFKAARAAAPAIIFIDEVDAIGQRRGGGIVSNDEREQTLNQMLAEMDGFDPSAGVVVLAATNRPEILDPALLRPGRFDRQVEIPLPNQRERTAILAVHARDKHLDGVDFDAVARATPGFSGADLANLVNEAAIVAVRENRSEITAADFSAARDRILLGRREATNALLPQEKHAVAVHESGHALVAEVLPNADPVEKVTILPAGQALGVTEQLPADERHLYPESFLKDTLAVHLGGRAAELLVLGEASSGAASDLAGATDLATRMVREYGMSSRLGPVGFASGSPMYLGTEEVRSRPYADETQTVIDQEVSNLLREAERRALDTLDEHRAALDRLVEELTVHETLDGDAVRAALRGTPDTDAPPKEPARAN